MSLDAQILLSLVAHESQEGAIARSLRATPATYSLTLADGTGEAQAQVAWSASRTLAGASETLNAAALTDERGAVSLSALKAVYVKNASTVTLTVTPSGSASAFGGTHHIRPGGVAVAVAPDATGMPAGEAVVAGAAGAAYDIILIGEGTVT
jgi:hypothetical protein